MVAHEIKEKNDSINEQVDDLGYELLELSNWADRKNIKMHEAVENENEAVKFKVAPMMYKLPLDIDNLEENKVDGEDSILERSLQRSLKKPITQNVKHRQGPPPSIRRKEHSPLFIDD